MKSYVFETRAGHTHYALPGDCYRVLSVQAGNEVARPFDLSSALGRVAGPFYEINAEQHTIQFLPAQTGMGGRIIRVEYEEQRWWREPEPTKRERLSPTAWARITGGFLE